jgi:YD repeat-containing protein
VQETNELGHSRFFQYDVVGNLTQKIDRNERVTKYDYDRLNRLATESWFDDVEDNTANREIDYTYDLLSRLLSSVDPDHGYSYSYARRDLDQSTSHYMTIAGLTDAAHAMESYDAVGRMTGTNIELGEYWSSFSTFEYDNLNRLESVLQWFYPHDEITVTKLVDFTYDLTGQLDSSR